MFEKIGLKTSEVNEYYGVVNNYCFTLKFLNYNNSQAYVLAMNYSENSKMGIVIDFLSEKKEFNPESILNFTLENSEIKVFLSDNVQEQFLESLINDLSLKLEASNVKNVCNHCKKEKSLNFYKYNNGLSVLCLDCGEKLINQIQENKVLDNNYIQGFFGSLIGAIIGSLLWILIGLAGFYASVAGYAIAFGAFKGYKIFKGKTTVVGVVLNIITILLAFIVANYVGIYFDIRSSIEGLDFKTFFSITPFLLKEPGVIKELVVNFGLGLLFVVLGSYKTILEYLNNAKVLKDAKVIKLN